MAFRFKISIAFILALCPIELHASIAKGPNFSRAIVRDFAFYREFKLSDGSRITLYKNDLNRKTSYLKNNVSITVTQGRNKSLTEYTYTDKKLIHTVLFKTTNSKIRQVGYYKTYKAKYYKLDTNNKCSLVAIEQDKIALQELSEKIGSYNVEGLLDKSSCSNTEDSKKEKLVDAVNLAFDVQNSSFVKCINSPRMQAIFAADQSMQSAASNFLAKYISTSEKIFSGEKPIVIQCKVPKTDKKSLGFFDKSQTPEALALNLDYVGDFKSGLIPELINHELLHSTDKSCVAPADEAVINNLTCYCNAELKNLATKTSESILDECKNPSQIIVDSKLGSDFANAKKDNLGVAAKEIADLGKKEESESTSKALKNLVEPVSFTPINSSDAVKLANDIKNTDGLTVPKDGSPQEVYFSDDMASSFKNVSEGFYKAATSTTKALGAAITQVAVANANMPGTSAINTAPSSTVATATGSTVGTYQLPEIVADKYSKDFNQPDKESTALAASLFPATTNVSTLSTSSTTGENKNSKAISTSTLPGAPGLANLKTAAASRSPSSLGTATAVSIPDSDESPPTAKESEEKTSIPTRSIASIENTQTQIQPPIDNKALQALSALSKVGGDEYAEIRNKYTDTAFINELKRRNIRIIYTNAQGQKIVVGKTTQAKSDFVDNGTALVKIP